MKKLHCDTIAEFVQNVIDTYEQKIKKKDDLEDVAIICYFHEAQEILKILLQHYDVGMIDLASPIYGGYDREYIISLLDNEIWVEFAHVNGKYLQDESYITYVFDDCHSSILQKLDSEEMYEVSVGKDADKENTEKINIPFKIDDIETVLDEHKNGSEHKFETEKAEPKTDKDSFACDTFTFSVSDRNGDTIRYNCYCSSGFKNDDIVAIVKALKGYK